MTWNGERTDNVPWTVPTYANGWSNYGAPFVTTRYRKVNGDVKITAMMKGGTPNTVAFTLPPGCCPSGRLLFDGVSSTAATGPASAGTAHVHNTTDAAVRVQIDANGDVSAQNMGSTATWLAFTISFPAEQ